MSKNSENSYISDKIECKVSYKLLGQQVCRRFFLNTLGLHSASKITKLFQKYEISKNKDLNEVLKENRGKNKIKANDFDNKLKAFIDSYEAQPSHYSLAKTPKRRYIDSESKTYPIKMYKEFSKQTNFRPILKNNNNLKSRNFISEDVLNSCNFNYFRKKLKLRTSVLTNLQLTYAINVRISRIILKISEIAIVMIMKNMLIISKKREI